MKTKDIPLDLVYYLEDGDLTIHCPQLTIFGVAPYDGTTDLDDFARKTLDIKLHKRLNRFESTHQFIEHLMEYGHWIGDSVEEGQPAPFKELSQNMPNVADILEMDGSRHITFQYRIDLS